MVSDSVKIIGLTAGTTFTALGATDALPSATDLNTLLGLVINLVVLAIQIFGRKKKEVVK